MPSPKYMKPKINNQGQKSYSFLQKKKDKKVLSTHENEHIIDKF